MNTNDIPKVATTSASELGPGDLKAKTNAGKYAAHMNATSAE